MFKLLSIPGLLLAGALTFMAAPPSQVAATECGRAAGPECSKTESCVSIIFFKSCTTKTKYYNVF